MAMVIEAGRLTNQFGGTQAPAGVDMRAESGQALALPGAEL